MSATDESASRKPQSHFEQLGSDSTSAEFTMTYRTPTSRGTNPGSYDFQDLEYDGISHHLNSEHTRSTGTVLDEGDCYLLGIDESDLLSDFAAMPGSSASDSLMEPPMNAPVSPHDDIGRSDASIFTMKNQDSSASRQELLSLGSTLINFEDVASFGYPGSSAEAAQVEITSSQVGPLSLQMQHCGALHSSLEDFVVGPPPTYVAAVSSSCSEILHHISSAAETSRSSKFMGNDECRTLMIGDQNMTSVQATSYGIVTPVIQAVPSKKYETSTRPMKAQRSININDEEHYSLSPVHGQIFSSKRTTQPNRDVSLTTGATVASKTQTQTVLSASPLEFYSTNITEASTPDHSHCMNDLPIITSVSSGRHTPDSTARDSALIRSGSTSKTIVTDPTIKKLPTFPTSSKFHVNNALVQNLSSNKLLENSGLLHNRAMKHHDFAKPSNCELKFFPETVDRSCSKNKFVNPASRATASPVKTSGRIIPIPSLRNSSMTGLQHSLEGNFAMQQTQNNAFTTRPDPVILTTSCVAASSTENRLGNNVLRHKETTPSNKSSIKGHGNRQYSEFSVSPLSPGEFQQNVAVASSSPQIVIQNTSSDLATSALSPTLSHQVNDINMRDDDDLMNMPFSTSLEEEFGVSQGILGDNLEEESAGSLADLQGLSTSLTCPDIFTANGIKTSFVRNHSITQNLPHGHASEMTLTFSSAFLDNSNMSLDISNLSDDDISVSNTNLMDALDRNFSPRKSTSQQPDLTFSQMLDSAIGKKEDDSSTANLQISVNTNKIPSVISQDVNLATTSQRDEEILSGTLVKPNQKVHLESNALTQAPLRTSKTSIRRKDPHQSSDTLLHQVCYRCRFCPSKVFSNEHDAEEHMKNDHPDHLNEVDDSNLENHYHKPKKVKVYWPRTSSVTENLPKYKLPEVMVPPVVSANNLNPEPTLKNTVVTSHQSHYNEQKSVPQVSVSTLKINTSVIRSASTLSPLLIPAEQHNSSKKSEVIQKHVDASTLNEADTLNVVVSQKSSAVAVAKDSGITRAVNDSQDGETFQPIITWTTDACTSTNLEEVDLQTKQRRKKSIPKSGRPFASKSVGIAKVRKKNCSSDETAKLLGFRCDVGGCGLRLTSQDKVEYHRRCHPQVALGDEDYEAPATSVGLKCPECPKTAQQWRLMATHLWRAHFIDIDMHKCTECDFRCYSASRLMKSHMPSHTNMRPFLCESCGKVFKTYKHLKSHKTNSHSKPLEAQEKFTCEICNKNFVEKRMLQGHIDVLHNKVRRHLCSHCGKAFGSKTTLVLHMRTHTGEKPFACDHCDYRTSDHNSLRRHKMQHSKDKRYKCTLCSYSSIQSTSYKVHLSEKHFNEAVSLGLLFACNECKFKTVKHDMYRSHLANQHGIILPPDPPPNQEGFSLTVVKKLEKNNGAAAAGTTPSADTKDVSTSTANSQTSLTLTSNPNFTINVANPVDNGKFDGSIFWGDGAPPMVVDDVEFKRINSMDDATSSTKPMQRNDHKFKSIIGERPKLPSHKQAMKLTVAGHGAGKSKVNNVQKRSNRTRGKQIPVPVKQEMAELFERKSAVEAVDRFTVKPTENVGLLMNNSNTNITPSHVVNFSPKVIGNSQGSEHIFSPSFVPSSVQSSSQMGSETSEQTLSPSSNSSSSVASASAPVIIGRIEVDHFGNLVLISDGNFEKANLNGTAVVLPRNLAPLVTRKNSEDSQKCPEMNSPQPTSMMTNMNDHLNSTCTPRMSLETTSRGPQSVIVDSINKLPTASSTTFIAGGPVSTKMSSRPPLITQTRPMILVPPIVKNTARPQISPQTSISSRASSTSTSKAQHLLATSVCSAKSLKFSETKTVQANMNKNVSFTSPRTVHLPLNQPNVVMFTNTPGSGINTIGHGGQMIILAPNVTSPANKDGLHKTTESATVLTDVGIQEIASRPASRVVYSTTLAQTQLLQHNRTKMQRPQVSHQQQPQQASLQQQPQKVVFQQLQLQPQQVVLQQPPQQVSLHPSPAQATLQRTPQQVSFHRQLPKPQVTLRQQPQLNLQQSGMQHQNFISIPADPKGKVQLLSQQSPTLLQVRVQQAPLAQQIKQPSTAPHQMQHAPRLQLQRNTLRQQQTQPRESLQPSSSCTKPGEVIGASQADFTSVLVTTTSTRASNVSNQTTATTALSEDSAMNGEAPEKRATRSVLQPGTIFFSDVPLPYKLPASIGHRKS
ncbi:uncharacterized protein LOC108681520 [Hyalella azteca]|uniref:Uncharacterized protein LOC108681520 n=1 Tax=Hyalella azteca TaxID=294128 RepID=A0A8B7PIR3_HYAAZ|nr:uncharacterized protein LOC108681520 [Hyalella azteca]